MTASLQRPRPIRAWAVLAVLFGLFASGTRAAGRSSTALLVDSPQVDLQYPIIDPPATGDNNTGTIDLGTPSNVTNDVVYDPVTGDYILQSRMGDNIA